MKVTHVNTTFSEAYAYVRLHNALLEQGIESRVLTQGHSGSLVGVYDIGMSLKDKLHARYDMFRYPYKNIAQWVTDIGPFSTGSAFRYITNHELIRDCDIINLHWICNTLSIKQIAELIHSHKRIVWTCHDSWPFTGGCHVKYDCKMYQSDCSSCIALNDKADCNLANRILQSKKNLWRDNNFTFVAPSKWMKSQIEASDLFKNNRVEVIANTIDTSIFRELGATEIEKCLGRTGAPGMINVLFGAADINVPYKGLKYLLEMLEALITNFPKLREKIVLHVFGTEMASHKVLNKFRCVHWGYVDKQEKMAALYNMADLLVFPSIDDNFPGVVLEALACGTPVVAFKTGGIPDMVIHRENGYIAEYKNSADLLRGLIWVLNNNINNKLGRNGMLKVQRDYNSRMVATKYIQVYNSLLSGDC